MDLFFIVVTTFVSSALMVFALIVFFKATRFQINLTYFVGGILLLCVGNGLGIFSLVLTNLLGQFCMGLGLIFIFLHYERIARNRPKGSLLCTVFAFEWGIVILFFTLLVDLASSNNLAYLLTAIQTGNFTTVSNTHARITLIFSQLSVSLLFYIILLRASLIMMKIWKQSRNKASGVELLGLSLLLLYRIILDSRFFFSERYGFYFGIIALIWAILSLCVLIFNYILHPSYLYLLPFPVHSFLIYNKSGILRYFREVKTTNQGNASNEDAFCMISGALTAIFAIIQETLGKKAQIQFIDAQYYRIYFNQLPNENGTFVVIAYGGTACFQSSLKRFGNAFTQDALDNLNAKEDLNSLRPIFDHLIQRSFPYVSLLDSPDVDALPC